LSAEPGPGTVTVPANFGANFGKDGLTKSREDLEIEKLVEIDGEFCVPTQVGEVRHLLDWGPFEAPRDAWYVVRKLLLFLPAMYLFILAIQIMKAGASAIGPQIQGEFPFANGISTLGFGWLGAYFVLSGSPVAASAISLFGAGTLTKLQTFTMLSGSRLGASFIVLLTGFIYAFRNRRDPRRNEPIGMGIQALTMTALVYLPGMMIGYAIIRGGLLDGFNLHASAELEAALAVVWGPVVDGIEVVVPDGLLFLAGLAVILASFRLLDLVLPQVSSDSTAAKRASWLRRPWTMFALGCLVATLTLSVSVALTVLIPLAAKGYLRRDEALPYIMGANITTLADTLVVAMLQRDPAAAQIVLAEAIGVTIVSLAILAFWYQPVKRSVIRLDDYLVASNRRIAVFVGILFVLPISFLLSGLWIGPIVPT
jgi:solute carrier family 34 (sodium-dependent phosphate cotransporter)